jgi:hypothetical protein
MQTAVFTDKIKQTIEQCAYNFFVVQQDENFKCSCVNHSTKQPDPACKKCLGTGFKVKIKKMRGACYEEMKGGATLSSKTSRIMRTYYVDNKYDFWENNYIIDRGQIYYVYRSAILVGLGGEITHKQVTSVLKTEDHDKVLKNFMHIINNKLTDAQKGEFPWLT